MKVTKAQQVTYLGVPATVREYRRTADSRAERLVVTEWRAKAVGQPVEHPAGSVTVRHIKGDGRKPDFVCYGEWTGTVEEGRARVERLTTGW